MPAAQSALFGVPSSRPSRYFSKTSKPVILGTMESAAELVDDELGIRIGESFDLNARPIQEVLGGVGRRVQQVTDVSRRRVANMVADGIDKGLSAEQIVRGVKPGTRSVRGPIPAFEGISKMAETLGADVIAIATHGYGGLRRVMAGSVADGILHSSPLPLLVQRPAG